MNVTLWAAGLGCGLLAGWLGRRSRYLTWGGAAVVAAAIVLGFVSGEALWGVPPVVWAVGNTLWWRYRRADKDAALRHAPDTGSQRWDAMLARLGWAMLLALYHGLAPEQPALLAAYVGALAASAADTWATEAGLLSVQPPRSLISRRAVPAGTPGATSMLGAVASLGGAWLIGFSGLAAAWVAAWLSRDGVAQTDLWLAVATMVGGTGGALVDSFLGATAQGIYYCEHCERYVETRRCACGGPARQIRGWSWLNNEAVDLVGTVVGAAATVAVALWLAQWMW